MQPHSQGDVRHSNWFETESGLIYCGQFRPLDGSWLFDVAHLRIPESLMAGVADRWIR